MQGLRFEYRGLNNCDFGEMMVELYGDYKGFFLAIFRHGCSMEWGKERLDIRL